MDQFQRRSSHEESKTQYWQSQNFTCKCLANRSYSKLAFIESFLTRKLIFYEGLQKSLCFLLPPSSFSFMKALSLSCRRDVLCFRSLKIPSKNFNRGYLNASEIIFCGKLGIYKNLLAFPVTAQARCLAVKLSTVCSGFIYISYPFPTHFFVHNVAPNLLNVVETLLLILLLSWKFLFSWCFKSGLEIKQEFQSEKTAWHKLIIVCILIFIRDPIMWESHSDLFAD